MSYVLLISLGFIPSLAWLFFFLKEDVHPEPKKIIMKVFIAGASITFATIFLQIYLQKLLFLLSWGNIHPLPFFLFAFIEEALKFFAAWIIIKKSKFFDEPVDAMIYMIVAALGFALVENIAVAMNIGAVSEAIGVITIRFVGATLLHALGSGIVGYYWAKAIMVLKKDNNLSKNIEGIIIFKGIIIASAIHTIFNYLILVSGEAIIVYPTIFLAVIALFIFWDFDKIKKYG